METCKAIKKIYQPSTRALKFAATKHHVPTIEAWARTEVSSVTW